MTEPIVSVRALTKVYRVHEREEGLGATLRGVVRRRFKEVPSVTEATFAIESLDLVEGTYKVDVAIHKRDGFPYDYHRLLYTFRVKSRVRDVGIYRPRHRWTFSPNVTFKAER